MFGNDAIDAIRVIGGASFLLTVPGFALTLALFPRRSLGGPARLLLSIGLSISAVVLGSIALHWLGVRLDLRSWTLVLASVAAAGLAGATIRRRSFLLVPTRRQRLPRTSIRSAFVLAAAGLVGIVAVLLARTPLPARGVQGNTAVWLLPAGPGLARVGVSSSELHAKSYRLVITNRSGSWSVLRKVRLAPGATWQATLKLRERRPAERVLARLFDDTSPRSSYRLATLTVRNRE